jgi:hypothetical protein
LEDSEAGTARSSDPTVAKGDATGAAVGNSGWASGISCGMGGGM